jgi:hypothetical protein
MVARADKVVLMLGVLKVIHPAQAHPGLVAPTMVSA